MSVLNDMAMCIYVTKLEKQLNDLICDIRNHNGRIWLQDRQNKDLYIELDRPLNLNYFYEKEANDE